MTYVISDLHGYPLEKLKRLLAAAAFGEADDLYILGDVIDRNGDGGLGVLRWLLSAPNARLILGNHEAMLLSCEFVFDEITEESVSAMTAEKMALLTNYMLNGGEETLRAFHDLPAEARRDLLDYLREAPLYDAVTAGGRDYLFVHAGLDHFAPEKKIRDYAPDDLLWAKPRAEDVYYPDIHTVFGHTPTKFFDPAFDGRIFRTETWTCIDCGAAYGNEPVLLRLDDGKEFRLSV